MNNKERNLLIFIPTVICIVAVCVVAILLILKAFSPNSQDKSKALTEKRDVLFEEKLKNVARSFSIPEKNFKTDIDLEERRVTVTIYFPKVKLIEEFVMYIFAAVEDSEYAVIKSEHIRKGKTSGKKEYVNMIFENKKRPNERINCEIIITNERILHTAKAAFLIKGLDKLSPQNSDALLAFGEPLNFILTPWRVKIITDSVWTDDGKTQKTARKYRDVIDSIAPIFSKSYLPVLIEIPIEDSEGFENRKYAIKQSDDKNKMERKMKMLSEKYPNAVGFYSKTGNLVLNSREISKTFLEALKKRGKVFYDARSNRNETAKNVAEELLVSYNIVSFSLPSRGGVLSKEEWEIELKNVCERAIRNKNSVILISADDNFVEALIKTLPHIKKRGIQFVPITHL
ncbi:MAG: divergent polysaccharide deacetylase family protein [Chitinivibrionia bacterium]|nr:divergent polysaccharide deacetylase family protein [Chitinivibrionia bacterium]